MPGFDRASRSLRSLSLSKGRRIHSRLSILRTGFAVRYDYNNGGR